jgi:hypothetical protein
MLVTQAYEECNITARPHNSFEDQQLCDLVQILDNQDFCPYHFIETTDTLDILDDEYEGTEHTDQPPDSNEGASCSHQAMMSSHRIQATTHIQRRSLMRVLK